MNQQQKPLWLKYLPVTALAIGAVSGWVLFHFGTYHLLGAVAKALAVLIGSAWVTLMAFATKVSDITESPALTPDEHRRLEAKCRKSVRRIWELSVANAIAVLFVLIPSAMVDGKTAVYEWMIIVACMAAGFAVYSIAIHAWWQEELRSFRSELRLREREKIRMAEQKSLFAGSTEGGEVELNDEIAKLNRSFDWPSENQIPH